MDTRSKKSKLIVGFAYFSPTKIRRVREYLRIVAKITKKYFESELLKGRDESKIV